MASEIARSGRFVNGSVVREESGPLGTPGTLLLDSQFTCNTLELDWHDNERGVSCIKPMTYRGWVWWSDHLGRRVIRLEDKNGRKDCLLHNGTFAGDVSEGNITQIHGCTIVGKGYAKVLRPDGQLQFGIVNSKGTLESLVESLKNDDGSYDDVLLSYIWREGCAPAGV
jgi:hypothetical protein